MASGLTIEGRPADGVGAPARREESLGAPAAVVPRVTRDLGAACAQLRPTLLAQVNLGLLQAVRRLSASGIREALSPAAHTAVMTGQRVSLLVSRIRFVAGVFALLTPLWSLIDMIALPPGTWRGLLLGRLVASAAFAAIAWFTRDRGRLLDAYLGLAGLLTVPILFYVFFPVPPTQQDGDVLVRAVATGYALLPVIVVAGIGIFPLTLLESAVVALSATAALSLATFAASSGPLVISESGFMWVLLLLAGISSLTSMSQSGFLAGLVERSARDPLTGCLNRRIGEQLLDALLSGAIRRGGALSVAFIDLDHFKSVNDDFGHREGDRVLHDFAERLQAGLRKADFVIRWGGEEFLVILPEADAAAAAAVLGRIAVAGLGTRPDGQPQTASIGIAECRADEAADPHTIVEEADARMYRAKLAGRARIVGP